MFNRAKWFKVHSWVGFKLSILICFTLITGTLAVLSHEIDWLTNPAMRVDSQTVTETNWQAIYKNARALKPDSQIMHLKAPIDPWFAAELVYFETKEIRHRLFFHPTTGEYLGEGRWYNWQRFFRMSHRHLMIPTQIGITIVASLGFLMMISLVTSLVVYRKWWSGFFRMPRTSHRKFFWADVHRLFGVWSIWFVFIIALTGIWYFVEIWGLKAQYPDRGKPLSEIALQEQVMPSVINFSTMVSQLATDYPELEVEIIQFPRKGSMGLVFQGQAEAILVRPRANMVSYDPLTAQQLALNKGKDLSIHARISEASDPLHFGTFAGITSKLVYFVFGIVLSVLAVSGTYIYGMRIAKVSKQDETPRRKFWQAAISKMGWGKWLSIVAILVCLIVTVLLFGGFVTQ